MTYQLYQLTFKSSHFGQGSLDTASPTFTADRLFSALVLEALKQACYDEFMALAFSDEFVLSDAFPYREVPYLPKPIGYPSNEPLEEVDDIIAVRQQAKQLKKLQYIAESQFSTYLAGQMDLSEPSLAKMDYVSKNQPGVDGALYQVGVSYYETGVSLYVIASASPLLDQLMTGLQFSGLGGKRTSGLGLFELTILDLPDSLSSKLRHEGRRFMLLSGALPLDDQLEDSMADGAYLLQKASGFAYSQENKTNLRKQDVYKFKAGSTFSKTFDGQILDVRPKGFPHPVWHYAKPLFYSLED